MTAPPSAIQRFHATAKLGSQTTDGLVIMCSDRRFRPATEEFITDGLHLYNYDALSVPGGVYMLSFADALPKQLKVGMRMIQYLLKSHMPARVVLIAHSDCGRYREGLTSWLRRQGSSLEDKQLRDLADVARELKSMAPSVPVEAYFGRSSIDDSVVFESV